MTSPRISSSGRRSFWHILPGASQIIELFTEPRAVYALRPLILYEINGFDAYARDKLWRHDGVVCAFTAFPYESPLVARCTLRFPSPRTEGKSQDAARRAVAAAAAARGTDYYRLVGLSYCSGVERSLARTVIGTAFSGTTGMKRHRTPLPSSVRYKGSRVVLRIR